MRVISVVRRLIYERPIEYALGPCAIANREKLIDEVRGIMGYTVPAETITRAQRKILNNKHSTMR